MRAAGAVPATIGVLDGRIRVGLSEDELGRFTPDARKLGPARPRRVRGRRRHSARPPSAGSSSSRGAVGIRFLGTGGIGGVHRGYPNPPDVSADLVALVTTPVLVVCSGAKSLLDIPATMEYLETLGIPVLGYRTDTLPLFYSATGGPPIPQRVDDAGDGRPDRQPRTGSSAAAASSSRTRRPRASRSTT